MAATSLLALLDDITTILDDVSLLTKTAATKTAGVLGDDLALNAQQVTGVRADRELPVVWAVAKGSLVNKAILIPAALLISATCNAAIGPILMLGGAYLCFEGFEKVWHVITHTKHRHPHESETPVNVPKDFLKTTPKELEQFERDKIRGAIRTDFVLSAEIVTIALGTVANERFTTQVLVLCAIGIVMTLGVYGLVLLIVKMDDFGYYLCRGLPTKSDSGLRRLRRMLGFAILKTAPWLMRLLSFAGTVAMFLVGGGILVHGMPFAHTLEHYYEALLPHSTMVHAVASTIASALVGVIAGAILVASHTLIGKMRSARTH